MYFYPLLQPLQYTHCSNRVTAVFRGKILWQIGMEQKGNQFSNQLIF